MKTKKFIFQAVFMLILVIMAVPSCDVVKQAGEMLALRNCQFRLKTVENLNLAGISVQNVQSASNLGITDLARLTAAVGSNNLPLSFTLNVEGKNPNSGKAGMTALDWILYIDDIQMTKGSLNRSFSIAPNNGTAVIPLQMSFNLKEVLKGKTLETITNFGLNLAGAGNKPTRFMLKLKPTINIGGVPLVYPDYLTVKTSFVGN